MKRSSGLKSKKLYGANILDDKAYKKVLSTLSSEATKKREKENVRILLTNEEDGKSFFLLIKKTVKHNLFDEKEYLSILDDAQGNILGIMLKFRVSGEKFAEGKRYYIETLKFLLENKKLTKVDFQDHICWLIEVRKINREEVLEVVSSLLDEDCSDTIKLIKADEKFISTLFSTKRKEILRDQTGFKMQMFLNRLSNYLPEKIPSFFSFLIGIAKNDRVIDQFLCYLFFQKVPLKVKKSILKIFINTKGVDRFISFMDRNIPLAAHSVMGLSPDFMNDTAIHNTVKYLLQSKKITLKPVKRWRSKIAAELESRKSNNESEEGIKDCEEALASYDQIDI